LRIVVDGIYYACGLTLAGLVFTYFLNPWMGLPFYILAAFCLYFFRDPERVAPSGRLLLSPADGEIVSVKRVSPELTRISIFLNIFNVHVNRTPIPGVVTEVAYRKGKFLIASHDEASVENEQNTLVIEGNGTRVICRQIAGFLARRIVCYKRAGDPVGTGERIGYIKFGSRVDVFFGPEWIPAVKVGDRVAGGSSILARPANSAEVF
jgi:phosphatidylserine decarboxylase